MVHGEPVALVEACGGAGGEEADAPLGWGELVDAGDEAPHAHEVAVMVDDDAAG